MNKIILIWIVKKLNRLCFWNWPENAFWDIYSQRFAMYYTLFMLITKVNDACLTFSDVKKYASHSPFQPVFYKDHVMRPCLWDGEWVMLNASVGGALRDFLGYSHVLQTCTTDTTTELQTQLRACTPSDHISICLSLSFSLSLSLYLSLSLSLSLSLVFGLARYL